MTFKEFFNKQDNTPFTLSMKPAKASGLQVVKDFAKDVATPSMPAMPSTSTRLPKSPMLPGKNRLGDRPVEKKPTNFLPRASTL